ncbi:MAG TPA: bifunctional hydroxymethylpyrimidine kinase/phosphomethylpyrimidine kinase [Steroidobacteraceae bacterium]|nr:bifunctional hydroxymethylpyrimidine kinase/phosphomethylpyrimidine kinase [Steroidobacteraceae bacterium]
MTRVLLIGGSDSSGGAGLTRDVSTLTRLGAEGLPVVTAVTAQTDAQVLAVHVVPASVVHTQIAAALSGKPLDAVKIGMLATRATVLAVATALAAARLPIVLDPVLVSSSGAELLDAAGREALCTALLPRATVLTPNIPEAAALLGTGTASAEEQLLRQAAALLALGPAAVLLKGGHAEGPEAADLLLTRDAAARWLRGPRIDAARRGTGCTLAAAIAAGLGAGLEIGTACERARQQVRRRLRDPA